MVALVLTAAFGVLGALSIYLARRDEEGGTFFWTMATLCALAFGFSLGSFNEDAQLRNQIAALNAQLNVENESSEAPAQTLPPPSSALEPAPPAAAGEPAAAAAGASDSPANPTAPREVARRESFDLPDIISLPTSAVDPVEPEATEPETTEPETTEPEPVDSTLEGAPPVTPPSITTPSITTTEIAVTPPATTTPSVETQPVAAQPPETQTTETQTTETQTTETQTTETQPPETRASVPQETEVQAAGTSPSATEVSFPEAPVGVSVDGAGEATAETATPIPPPTTPLPTSSLPTPAVADAVSADLSGTWEMTTTIERTAYPAFAGLELTFRLEAERSGDAFTAAGNKAAERAPGATRTLTYAPSAANRIALAGSFVDADTLALSFEEGGASGGTMTLRVVSAERLEGVFLSSSADSGGSVVWRKVGGGG